MTATQKIFKRKLIGFGVLLAFFIFSVLCLSVYKVAAQTQDNSAAQETIEPHEDETQAKSTDPGVIKYAFLAAAIVVGVGSIGAGAAVGYVGAAAMGAIQAIASSSSLVRDRIQDWPHHTLPAAVLPEVNPIAT